jgi:hypothetical protein
MGEMNPVRVLAVISARERRVYSAGCVWHDVVSALDGFMRLGIFGAKYSSGL